MAFVKGYYTYSWRHYLYIVITKSFFNVTINIYKVYVKCVVLKYENIILHRKKQTRCKCILQWFINCTKVITTIYLNFAQI